MMVFAIGIEHPLDVPVQGSQDADAREHRWPVTAIRKRDCISGDVAFPRDIIDAIGAAHKT
jgi:hypothetical protein